MKKRQSYKDIVLAIAKREGKKVPVNAAQIWEILGIVADLAVRDSRVIAELVRVGERRSK